MYRRTRELGVIAEGLVRSLSHRLRLKNTYPRLAAGLSGEYMYNGRAGACLR